ncbi:MAG: valine--tRNA ligase, partial [Chloroflexi bacterium]|nr:valine--tRNA ligase [Chloroflexota bacterium]
EAKVEPAKFIAASVVTQDSQFAIENHVSAIVNLARVKPLTILRPEENKGKEEQAKVLVLRDVEVILPLAGMVDLGAERARLQKEIDGARSQVSRIEAKLTNEQFLSKAPANVVEKERANLAEHRDRLARLQSQLDELKS